MPKDFISKYEQISQNTIDYLSDLVSKSNLSPQVFNQYKEFIERITISYKKWSSYGSSLSDEQQIEWNNLLASQMLAELKVFHNTSSTQIVSVNELAVDEIIRIEERIIERVSLLNDYGIIDSQKKRELVLQVQVHREHLNKSLQSTSVGEDIRSIWISSLLQNYQNSVEKTIQQVFNPESNITSNKTTSLLSQIASIFTKKTSKGK